MMRDESKKGLTSTNWLGTTAKKACRTDSQEPIQQQTSRFVLAGEVEGAYFGPSERASVLIFSQVLLIEKALAGTQPYTQCTQRTSWIPSSRPRLVETCLKR